MPRNVSLRDDTQYATVYADSARTDPVMTLTRRHAYERTRYAWVAHDLEARGIARFVTTAALIRFLRREGVTEIHCRPIDGGIITAASIAEFELTQDE